VSWWAIGWQIFATKYVLEIEDIFHQMSLLRDKIGITMPGNKNYVDTYIEGVWSLVTSLTSAIERNDTVPQWLVDKYEAYSKSAEEKIKGRLDKIQYDIDTTDTVHLVVGGDHIERVRFTRLSRCYATDTFHSIYSCFLLSSCGDI
jgi:hypothetical protein